MRRGWSNLNKSQRMQLKAFICVLGMLLLFLLLIGRLLVVWLDHGGEEEPEVHIPVIQEFANVWIMEADQEGLLIFRNGAEESYRYAPDFSPDVSVREQVADVELTDGLVTGVNAKREKCSGRLLSADEEGILVEGYGKLPLDPDYQGYRIYDSLEMCTIDDLAYGYDFTDLVLEDGRICGILMVKEEAMESIRVLVKASDYAGLYHDSVVWRVDTDFTLEYGEYEDPVTEQHSAGEELVVDMESPYLLSERMVVTPNALTGKVTLASVNRSQGIPAYRGHMEIYKTENGLVVINELPLEEYLYSVVPSEMPASYPSEALKAQAVCARTYAYGHMQRAGYPEFGAHVDDSTSYQVYNNILEQESTTTAVKESYGKLLFTGEGNLAGTYYYSTSCGVGTDANVWKTAEAPTLTYLKPRGINVAVMDTVQGKADEGTVRETEELAECLREEDAFREFITGKNAGDYEVSEAWYRWNYQVKKLDAEHLSEVLAKRYQVNEKLVLTLEDGEYVSRPVKAFDEVYDIYVAKRGPGGVCDELILETDAGCYKIISEHNIRSVLDDGESKVMRQDGKQVAAPVLLPSGFFVIDTVKEKKKVTGYTLTGGGFGHGVGMSQNGAKNMAKQGISAEQILSFFYEGCTLQNIYEKN